MSSNGNHRGIDIAKFFYDSITDFDIKNYIQGITVDNASANSVFMYELETLLKAEYIKFSAEDQHFRCIAHILNLAVQDVLKLLNIEFDSETNFMLDNGFSFEEENEISSERIELDSSVCECFK